MHGRHMVDMESSNPGRLYTGCDGEKHELENIQNVRMRLDVSTHVTSSRLL